MRGKVGIPVPLNELSARRALSIVPRATITSATVNNQTFAYHGVPGALIDTNPTTTAADIQNALTSILAPIVTITESGATATVTTATPNGVTAGQSVTLAGDSVSGYDGLRTVILKADVGSSCAVPKT